jgi:hypothetical protein
MKRKRRPFDVDFDKGLDCVVRFPVSGELSREWLALAPIIRHAVSTHLCIAEVYNGGFEQYFWNSCAGLAPEAVEGFEAFGMTDAARLVETAMKTLPKGFSRVRAERQAQVDSTPPDAELLVRLEELDDRFYLLIPPTGENVWSTEMSRAAASYRPR